MNGGWLNLCITEIVEEVPSYFSGAALLVTCIDSGTDTFRMKTDYLGNFESDCLSINGRLLIPAKAVPAFLSIHEFSGFDALFVLSSIPPSEGV